MMRTIFRGRSRDARVAGVRSELSCGKRGTGRASVAPSMSFSGAMNRGTLTQTRWLLDVPLWRVKTLQTLTIFRRSFSLPKYGNDGISRRAQVPAGLLANRNRGRARKCKEFVEGHEPIACKKVTPRNSIWKPVEVQWKQNSK